MKLTKQQLKQIVEEEMTTLMNEAGGAEKIRLDNPGFGGSWCEKWEELQANDPNMRLFEPEKWAAYKSECDQEQNRQWLRDIEVDQGIANPRGGSVRNPEAEKTWDRRWGAGTMRRTPDWRDVSENKLKLTKQQLKQIVKEEIDVILREAQLGAPGEVSGLNVEYVGFDTEHDLTTWHFRVTMGDSTQNVEVGPTTESDTDDLAAYIGDALGYDWDALNAAIERQLKDYPELVQDQKTAAAERAQYQGY